MNSSLPGDNHQITEAETFNEDLNELEKYINDVWQFLPIPTAYIIPPGVIIDVNERMLQFLHYSREEIIGKKIDEIGPEKEFLAIRDKTLADGHTQQNDIAIKDKNGNDLCADIHTFARRDEQNQCIGFFIAFIDTTKRKNAEKAAHNSERIYRDLVDNALIGVYKVNLKGDYIYVNDAMARMFEFDSAETMVMEGVLARYHDVKDRDRFIETLKKRGRIINYELELVTRSGQVINTIANATLEGEIISGMMMDITERRHNIELEKIILKIATDFINSTPGNLDQEINKALCLIGKFTGVGRSYLFKFSTDIKTMTNTHEWCNKDVESHIHRLKNIPVETFSWSIGKLLKLEVVNIPRVAMLPAEAANEKHEFELEKIKSVLLVPVTFAGQPIGFVGFDAVNSEKKWSEESINLLEIVSNIFANALKHAEVEESLRCSEERFRRLADNAKDLIFKYIYKPEPAIEYISPSVTNLVGYRPEELYGNPNFGFKIVHREDLHILQKLIESPAEIPSPLILRWLHKNGSVVWFELQSTVIRDVLGNVIALEGIARDITERMKAEQTIAESYKQLKKMLDGTVNALASTAEKKDPYTAGHQRRVTQLAIAIGKKMGLDSNRIEGIRVAGTLHDIGKIYVPTEILSKPTVLTYVEYSIVKTHAQIGYEILKNIEFPWPVTTIVIQHHERLDGSGYPHALKESDIILESRILTVADVVEAMASHRPYRPAPGIDTALDEIRMNKGILYDLTVAGCCLELFLKDGFKFD